MWEMVAEVTDLTVITDFESMAKNGLIESLSPA
jgi:hypothetical protein